MIFVLGPITPIFGNLWKNLTFGVSGTLTTILISWLFVRYEKTSLKEIGLTWQRGTVRRFFTGLLIGGALFGLMLSALLMFTPLQLQLNTKSFQPTALPGYFAFIPLSLMEEIGFRSYPFIKLNNQFGLRTTQLIVAIVFALGHVLGGQGVASSFLGPGIWAFVFGLAAVWSGGIAMPFGIHLALNLLQPLTGMRGDSGALWILTNKTDLAGGHMATPETVGLVMHLILLAGSLLMTEYYIRKKQERLPRESGENNIEIDETVFRNGSLS
jgi:membrane protease YdiL (CAAX protease family)